ncbi:unnamed protein product [Lathyrus sativus]|nr:unnamed protein product [Lathyrus sativus]
MENVGNVNQLISQDSAHQVAPTMEESFNSSLNSLTPSKETVETPNDETTDKMDTCDNIEALAETKKGMLRSKAWDHFATVKVNSEDKAQCKYCKKFLGGKSSNGTKHLLQHMETCIHRKIHENKTTKGQTFLMPKCLQGKQELEVGTYNAEKSRKELARAIIMHAYPLSIVDHIMGIASVLDPRYKMEYLEYYYEKLYEQDSFDQVKRIQQLCYDLVVDYQLKLNQENCGDSPVLESSRVANDSLDDYDAYVRKKKRARTSYVKTKLDHYLEEEVLLRSSDFDVLLWWKLNDIKYPTLQAIAKDILSIPISTVASESAFSTSGHILSPHCNRLHWTTLEALMCARSWLWSIKNSGGMSSKLSNDYTTLLDEIEPDEEGEILTSGVISLFEDGE